MSREIVAQELTSPHHSKSSRELTQYQAVHIKQNCINWLQSTSHNCLLSTAALMCSIKISQNPFKAKNLAQLKLAQSPTTICNTKTKRCWKEKLKILHCLWRKTKIEGYVVEFVCNCATQLTFLFCDDWQIKLTVLCCWSKNCECRMKTLTKLFN